MLLVSGAIAVCITIECALRQLECAIARADETRTAPTFGAQDHSMVLWQPRIMTPAMRVKVLMRLTQMQKLLEMCLMLAHLALA